MKSASPISQRTVCCLLAASVQILWVLTDDQDIELGGLTPMTFVREHLGEQGAVGEAFYVNTPM